MSYVAGCAKEVRRDEREILKKRRAGGVLQHHKLKNISGLLFFSLQLRWLRYPAHP